MKRLAVVCVVVGTVMLATGAFLVNGWALLAVAGAGLLAFGLLGVDVDEE